MTAHGFMSGIDALPGADVTPLLVDAFQQAFAGAELSDSLRPLLFEEYEHALLQSLGDLYGKLNALMAQGGLYAELAKLQFLD